VGGGLFTAQPHYMSHINHLLNDGSQLGRCAAHRRGRTHARLRELSSELRERAGHSGRAVPRVRSIINAFADDFNVPQTWKTPTFRIRSACSKAVSRSA
jgi:hypothetical protein